MKTTFGLIAVLFLALNCGSSPPTTEENLNSGDGTDVRTFTCFELTCDLSEICYEIHIGPEHIGDTPKHSCGSFPSNCEAKDCSCFPERYGYLCETTDEGAFRVTLYAP